MTATSSNGDLRRLLCPTEASQATAISLRDGEPGPGVTVLIPTYTSGEGDRTASLRHCMDSVLVAARHCQLPVSFVLVDNGLSPVAVRSVTELLSRSNCAYRVVRAVRARSGRYTAAEARNAGLAMLGAQADSSALRQRYLLFLDDDAALGTNALAELIAALRAEKAAIAACPKVVPVDDLAAWWAAQGARTRSAGTVPPAHARRLPCALTDDGYDLLSVTAYGSLITGRVVGLLVRQDPLLRWIRRHGPLFYTDTPYGSCEDILAMATLSRLGQLWSVPGVTVADEARKSPGATRRQQFAWGYDHAWLARTLAEAGLLDSGVNTLRWAASPPDGTAGWEIGRADWGGPIGFLINPCELRFGHRLLASIVSTTSVAEQMFGENADAVSAGIVQLGRVLDRWDRCQEKVPCWPRPDLPRLGHRDWSSLRNGLDSLVGHLAGNVAGSLHNSSDPAALPPFFLYGARQPASPPETPDA